MEYMIVNPQISEMPSISLFCISSFSFLLPCGLFSFSAYAPRQAREDPLTYIRSKDFHLDAQQDKQLLVRQHASAAAAAAAVKGMTSISASSSTSSSTGTRSNENYSESSEIAKRGGDINEDRHIGQIDENGMEINRSDAFRPYLSPCTNFYAHEHDHIPANAKLRLYARIYILRIQRAAIRRATSSTVSLDERRSCL
jgi:hypothetical protein